MPEKLNSQIENYTIHKKFRKMKLTIDSYLNSVPDYTEQIEKLLLSFKNNPKNAELLRCLIKEIGMYQTLKSVNDVCEQQKDRTPFVINVFKIEKDKLMYLPTSLYEYQGQAFVSISEALINALSDYSARSGITDKAELINLFQPLYGRQKGGKSALVTSNHKDFKAWTEGYMPTEFDDLYIRREIRYDKLELINRVLGDGHHITLISEDCYNNLVSPAPDMLKEANANIYLPVEGTSLYFRK